MVFPNDEPKIELFPPFTSLCLEMEQTFVICTVSVRTSGQQQLFLPLLIWFSHFLLFQINSTPIESIQFLSIRKCRKTKWKMLKNTKCFVKPKYKTYCLWLISRNNSELFPFDICSWLWRDFWYFSINVFNWNMKKKSSILLHFYMKKNTYFIISKSEKKLKQNRLFSLIFCNIFRRFFPSPIFTFNFLHACICNAFNGPKSSINNFLIDFSDKCLSVEEQMSFAFLLCIQWI